MGLILPRELAKSMAEGRVVLFAGAGMSAPQLPLWGPLLERMLDWAREECISLASPYGEIRKLIQGDKLLLAAQTIRSEIGEGNFDRFMQEVFRSPELAPGPVHRLLPTVKFASVLTTNFDQLIERAYPVGTPVYTQLHHARLAGFYRDRRFAVVKVHGDVDRPETIVVGQADYRQAMFGNEAFRIFLVNTFTTQTVLFTGCSLTDPDLLAFLDALTFKLGGNLGGAHFALMRTNEMTSIERRNFEHTWGIRIFGDDTRNDHPDIAGVLNQLGALSNASGSVAAVSAPLVMADAETVVRKSAAAPSKEGMARPLTEVVTSVEADMVYVPPGPFLYGEEKRAVNMEKGFWIDRCPVTNRQFCEFLMAQGNREEGGVAWLDHGRSRIDKEFRAKPGYEQHPVTGVSWFGAAAFAAWAGKRLPTEEEWEKAARGTNGLRSPWGEEFAAGRCNTWESGINDTTAIRHFREAGRSVYGCDDMVGNVWEWTASFYMEGKILRVARGGSWGDGRGVATCACRYYYLPDIRNNNLGFRCART